MPSFSLKAIDALVGPVRWDGFAAFDGSPLRDKRRCVIEGGPSWARDEPIDKAWQPVVWPVEEIAIAAIETGSAARGRAEWAARRAMRGGFHDVPAVPPIEELREIARDPGCPVLLREVRIELDFGGTVLTVIGEPGRQRVRGQLPPQAVRAARYAHHLAFVLAAAGLADMAALTGRGVPAHATSALDLVFGSPG